MTPKQRLEAKARKLEQAMFPLISDPRFSVDFMGVLREQRDEAVAYAISHDSVRDERRTLAALGEIRAYNDILAIAENYHTQLEERANREIEQAEHAQ